MKGNKNKKFLSEKLKIYMQMFSFEMRKPQRKMVRGNKVGERGCDGFVFFFNFMAQVVIRDRSRL